MGAPGAGDNPCMAAEFRLSEVIAALSHALDLTEGQPQGHAARSCLIGMRLATEIGLDGAEAGALYYALLLKDAGCSSNAARVSSLFGADDQLVKRQLKLVDWTRPTEGLRYARTAVAPHASPLRRAGRLALAAVELGLDNGALFEARCERGAQIVRMLEFPAAAAAAVRSLDEHWNGKGQPDGLRGEAIPILARIACVAQTVEVFHHDRGVDGVRRMLRERRGRWFDPAARPTCCSASPTATSCGGASARTRRRPPTWRRTTSSWSPTTSASTASRRPSPRSSTRSRRTRSTTRAAWPTTRPASPRSSATGRTRCAPCAAWACCTTSASSASRAASSTSRRS